MDKATTRAVQVLVSNLCEQVQRSVLRNRAYERVAPDSAEEASALLATPEFDDLRQQSSEIRRRVIAAVASEDWPGIFGGLGELIGILGPP